MPLLQFNFYAILDTSLVIQLHLFFAVLALLFGGVMWMRPKGTAGHKIIGRSFMLLMVLTALSAIFIREVGQGRFSLIHLFIPLALYSVIQSIRYIRKGNVSGHRRAVKGLYFGALILPGLFTLLPGRLLHVVLIGG